jgi:hypothetical protein
VDINSGISSQSPMGAIVETQGSVEELSTTLRVKANKWTDEGYIEEKAPEKKPEENDTPVIFVTKLLTS